MPYIKSEDRTKYNLALDQIDTILTKGELEYCIFKLMKIFIKDKESRYTTLHDCSYAAIHCGDEFRRRFLDKREDQAMTENGDVICNTNIDINDEVLTDDQYKQLVELRGGCSCHINPPCSACSEQITEQEAEKLGLIDVVTWFNRCGR